MVIEQNKKSVAYWYLSDDKIIFSTDIPRGKKYVRMVSETLPDKSIITRLYYGDKIVKLIDDNSCKSGYTYTLEIQKAIHKFLHMDFNEKKYTKEFKRLFGGLCE